MKSTSFIKVIIFIIISSLCIGIFAFLFGSMYIPSYTKDAISEAENQKYSTVIIDAGHGGEDGGASSAAGLIEKDVNLDIAIILRDLLISNGIDVIMTRDEDKLLYDRNTDYKGRKKKLDLAARVNMANTTPNAILVSIHMNSFTDPKYSGMQVWYSPNAPESFELAEQIRKANQTLLQTDNKRQTKCATSSINLLYNAKCPAVLVECGFLSNIEEAAKFEKADHRQKVAFVICNSIIEFLEKTKNER